MAKDDGGPAFPGEQAVDGPRDGERRWVQQSGMSLRDYFAGQALVMAAVMIQHNGNAFGVEAIPAAADAAYQIADAMLAERAK